MTKKPENFNINKRIGQVNQTHNLKGKLIERSEFLFVMMGEEITYVSPVYDPDHFIYQNVMPITEAEVKIKYLGILPRELRGAHIMCTCGSEAVIIMDGDYAGMAICKSMAQLGKHQTSFKIEDNKIIYDKKTQDEHFMGDSDIAKTMKSEEQSKDDHSDAIKKGSDLDE